MRKHLILSIHLLFSTVGVLEYCLSKGLRKFKYKPVSHYATRLPCDHPASQDIMISLTQSQGESCLTSYTLCTAYGGNFPLLVTGKIMLN